MPITSVVQTCWACPSQWDFMLDDKVGYARFRFGWLSVEVNGKEIIGESVGGEMDGVMSWEDVERRILDLLGVTQ